MADVPRDLGRLVAGLPVVNRAVRAVAVEVHRRAVLRAQAHQDTGELADSLTIESDGDTDWLVMASDPLAVAKEYGHVDDDTSHPVPGLHVLTGAAADVAGTGVPRAARSAAARR